MVREAGPAEVDNKAGGKAAQGRAKAIHKKNRNRGGKDGSSPDHRVGSNPPERRDGSNLEIKVQKQNKQK